MQPIETIAAFLLAAPLVVLSWQAPGSSEHPKKGSGELQSGPAGVGRKTFVSFRQACAGLGLFTMARQQLTES